MNLSKITATRFIRLGQSGSWAENCFRDGIIRLGFSSGTPEVLELAKKCKWEQVKNYWLAKDHSPQVASSYTNQMRAFFEDDGSTLWITIRNQYLYYGIAQAGDPIPYDEDPDRSKLSSFKKMSQSGWKNRDVNGKLLTIDKLSGRLTKVGGFQGTICSIKEPVADYLKLRIQGKINPVIEKTETLKLALQKQIIGLVRDLTWHDFETLVELIFSNSGWRRVAKTGGSKELVDIELENPITKDSAFVQVKSSTTQKQFDSYVNKMKASPYTRMFYVYHTGQAVPLTDEENISVFNVEQIAELVLSNGLIDWVVDRSK